MNARTLNYNAKTGEVTEEIKDLPQEDATAKTSLSVEEKIDILAQEAGVNFEALK
jgi:hypothetical protein